MGLAERRASKEFQDKTYPALQAEIQKLAGTPLPIEINWDQLAKEESASYGEESRRKN